MEKIGQSSFNFEIKFILILAMFYEQTKVFIFFHSVIPCFIQIFII